MKALSESGALAKIIAVHGWAILGVELIFGMLLAYKMKIKWWKALIILATGFLMLRYLNSFVYWIERGFEGEMTGGALTRLYLVMPLIYFLVFKLLKLNHTRAFDFVGLVWMLFQGMAHLGCFYNGCCSGPNDPNGIWNIARVTYTFPTPLYDAITAFLIFGVVFTLFALNGWEGGGIIYPVLLITHGVSRFVWDFYRVYPKLPCGLSTLQIWAIVLFFVGAALLALQIYLNVKRGREALPIKRKK